MDSLGDYIYLIVILIAGISSLLGKRKKKKRIESEEVDFPDLEDVIPEFAEYTQPERPVYQEIRKKVEHKSIPSYETVKDISIMKAKKQVRTVKQSPVLQLEEQEDSFLSEIELEDVDDVKKAFIYAEILNRKYT